MGAVAWGLTTIGPAVAASVPIKDHRHRQTQNCARLTQLSSFLISKLKIGVKLFINCSSLKKGLSFCGRRCRLSDRRDHSRLQFAANVWLVFLFFISGHFFIFTLLRKYSSPTPPINRPRISCHSPNQRRREHRCNSSGNHRSASRVHHRWIAADSEIFTHKGKSSKQIRLKTPPTTAQNREMLAETEFSEKL